MYSPAYISVYDSMSMTVCYLEWFQPNCDILSNVVIIDMNNSHFHIYFKINFRSLVLARKPRYLIIQILFHFSIDELSRHFEIILRFSFLFAITNFNVRKQQHKLLFWHTGHISNRGVYEIHPMT